MTKTTTTCFALALAAIGCGSIDQETKGPKPEGPIAENASEAWPKAPSAVPAISPVEIATACARAGECIPDLDTFTQQEKMALVDLCVFDATFSAERAIPLSGFAKRNERAEYFVRCTLDAADCSAVNACASERDDRIGCQEDGCRFLGGKTPVVSCSGSVATLTVGGSSFTRDCALAFAECDTESATGCTDRPFTACPPDAPKADRCDGNVRLGCDGAGQVSYRDCSRMGGTCQTAGDVGACVYTGATPECDPDGETPPAPASCDAGTLSVCVNGERLSLASGLCP